MFENRYAYRKLYICVCVCKRYKLRPPEFKEDKDVKKPEDDAVAKEGRKAGEAIQSPWSSVHGQ